MVLREKHSRWCHYFILHFSSQAALLHDVLWVWTEECQTASTDLKLALQRSPVLSPADFNKALKVQTDGSNTGLGAVLTQ